MMTKQYLLDSNIIVAYLNPHDSCHAKAQDFLKSIDRYQKLINAFILSEIATILLLRTKNNTVAKNFIEQLSQRKIKNFKIKTIDHKLITNTAQIFSSQAKNKLSFADCSLIAQAKTDNIKHIATLDKDLKKAFTKELKFWPK